MSQNIKIKRPREASPRDVWARALRRLLVNHGRNRHKARGYMEFVGCNSLSILSLNQLVLIVISKQVFAPRLCVYWVVYMRGHFCVLMHVEVTSRRCLSSITLTLTSEEEFFTDRETCWFWLMTFRDLPVFLLLSSELGFQVGTTAPSFFWGSRLFTLLCSGLLTNWAFSPALSKQVISLLFFWSVCVCVTCVYIAEVREDNFGCPLQDFLSTSFERGSHRFGENGWFVRRPMDFPVCLPQFWGRIHANTPSFLNLGCGDWARVLVLEL